MLRHMRQQSLRNPAPYAEVRAAAISVGLDPGGSECRALVDRLLRAGYLRRYPSPSLTAHGLYRLTDPGIAAADEAALEEARRRRRLNGEEERWAVSPGPTPRDRRRAHTGPGGKECLGGRGVGPQDPKDVARDVARDLSGMAGELVALMGDAAHWLREHPEYAVLLLRLENAHAALEAALVEARRRVRMDEER
jgi:hypothetical protein